MQLQDKVAIVTGADSGIGRAIAAVFAQAGADVCITYHSDADGAEETRRTVEAAGRRALVVQGDVGDPAAVADTFARSEPMTEERVEDPQKLEASLKKIPWGRVGQPEEIARLALFPAADTGDYVNGQTWTMDGGLTMSWGGA